MPMITDEMRGGMQGIIPSMLVSGSKDGEPNIAYVSQVYYVDESHVAISHQFFNKSIRNLQENPQLCVSIVNINDLSMWRLDLVHSHSESSGDLFDGMVAQLEAIASMMGMEGVFVLKAAEIFRVIRAEKMS